MGAPSAWICRAWSHAVTLPFGGWTAFHWRPKTTVGELAVTDPSKHTAGGGSVLRFTATDESGRIVVDLPAEQAWKLAEQIMVLVANHQDGDQRPPEEDRIASLSSFFATGLYQADHANLSSETGMVRVTRRDDPR